MNSSLSTYYHISTSLDLPHLFNHIGLVLLSSHLDMILSINETKASKRSLPLLNAIIIKVMDIEQTLAPVLLGLSS